MDQALVTGATGFIGGRLAEVALERGIPITGLVRRWSRAARLARLPVRMVQGDILDINSLRGAMKGCDVVFHCAVDNRVGGRAHRRSSVEGTTNVMQAALEKGVRRVVHLSSAAVYSYTPGPDAATEEGRYRYSGDPYCNGKIDAERVALRYYRKHGLPVTVLRPTIVYGPFAPLVLETVAVIREGRMVLVNGGRGVCNSLYVDNLVEAMLLAAGHDGVVGEALHISDAAPITWKAFIEAHACALGALCVPLREMTNQEIVAARAETRNQRPSSLKQALRLIRDPRMRQALRSIPLIERSARVGKAAMGLLVPAPARQVLQQKLLNENTNSKPSNRDMCTSRPLPSEAEVNMFRTFENVVFSIEKARRILGYDPMSSFEDGMEHTAAWIKWARL